MIQSQISLLDRRVISATVDCVNIATVIDTALTKNILINFTVKFYTLREDISRENQCSIKVAIFLVAKNSEISELSFRSGESFLIILNLQDDVIRGLKISRFLHILYKRELANITPCECWRFRTFKRFRIGTYSTYRLVSQECLSNYNSCSCINYAWTHLELLDATLLLERDLRLFRESPRFTTPLPVILKCRNL